MLLTTAACWQSQDELIAWTFHSALPKGLTSVLIASHNDFFRFVQASFYVHAHMKDTFGQPS